MKKIGHWQTHALPPQSYGKGFEQLLLDSGKTLSGNEYWIQAAIHEVLGIRFNGRNVTVKERAKNYTEFEIILPDSYKFPAAAIKKFGRNNIHVIDGDIDTPDILKLWIENSRFAEFGAFSAGAKLGVR